MTTLRDIMDLMSAIKCIADLINIGHNAALKDYAPINIANLLIAGLASSGLSNDDLRNLVVAAVMSEVNVLMTDDNRKSSAHITYTSMVTVKDEDLCNCVLCRE